MIAKASRLPAGSCPRSEMPASPLTDAALTILQSQGRITAYQRGDSWTYYDPTADEGRTRLHPALSLLSESNPHIVELACRDDEVAMAAVDWVKRNEKRLTEHVTEVQNYFLGDGVGGSVSLPGRTQTRLRAPHLEVEYSVDGGVRLIETRRR